MEVIFVSRLLLFWVYELSTYSTQLLLFIQYNALSGRNCLLKHTHTHSLKRSSFSQSHQTFISYFFNCSFVCSFVRSFIRSFVRSFVHSFIHSFIHLFIQSFIHSFVSSFVRSFIYSFIYSFIHSFG